MKNILFLSFVFGLHTAFSQDSLKKVNFQVEAATYNSTTEHMPFWLRSNQYGEVPYESDVVSFRGQVEKDYRTDDFNKSKTRQLNYGYKIRGIINAGGTNQFLLSEIYFKTKFKALELYLGRKKEVFGIADTTLGSGSYIWSGNALPIPKIQLSIPNYVPIFKNKLVSIKGSFAHGIMGSADSTQNYFLHQKSFYVKLGKPTWNVNFHGGFNHQVLWGGKPTNAYVQKKTKNLISEYPEDLNAYWYLLSGLSPADGGDNIDYNPGNHLGTIDFAIEFKIKAADVLFYKQSIYEKRSSLSSSNISDGLYGLSITGKNGRNGIVKVNFEYLNTSNQGFTSEANSKNGDADWQNDYFNNAIYKDGWAYKGNVIGSPFLMPFKYSPYLFNTFKNNPEISPNYIINNRVRAFIIGVNTKLNAVDLITRISLSNNLGNYTYTPIEVQQLSIQQQIIFPIKKYVFNANIGYDHSGLFNRNLGMVLMLKRSF